MTTIIKKCRGEKRRSIRTLDGFRKKIMIPDSEIPKCSEFEVKSKIGKIFQKHNPLEKYSVKIYEIDPYFYRYYEKKYKLIKMGANTYYLELMFISVEISSRNWWKRTYWQRYYFWIKKTRSTRKKLGCKFIRINTSNPKNGYYFDYEVGNIEAFIDEFKNKKIKELEDKIKQK